MLSGYRVLSRRFVESFPAVSCGFEVETEMTIHALELSLPFEEVETTYAKRPTGSTSKLRTIPDGFMILRFILKLFKDYRPLSFFGCLALAAALLAAATGGVARDDLHAWTPVALAVAALGALVVILPLAGVTLREANRGRRKTNPLLYPRGSASASVESRRDRRRTTQTLMRAA
jgi:hypothetical protein